MNNDLISRDDLKEHKFVGNKFVQIGGRTNGKTLESINKAYQQGWNDCIDAIIDNAPTVEPKKEIVPVCKVTFDKEQLQELVDKAIIRCQNCKHQKKYWHEDKRMKEKGYWIYGCDLIDDSFVGTPVWGADNQFCSSAEAKNE